MTKSIDHELPEQANLNSSNTANAASAATDPAVLQAAPGTALEKISLKWGEMFLVADQRGDLPATKQETGLYWRGTRHLSVCKLSLEGLPLTVLSYAVADDGNTCQIDLTNPLLQLGDDAIYQGTVHLRRVLTLAGTQLHEQVTLTNYHNERLTLRLGLTLEADFCDIFEVRGLARQQRGELLPPHLEGNILTLSYHGLDNITRETRCRMTPSPERSQVGTLLWNLTLEPHQPTELHLYCELVAAERVTQREPVVPEPTQAPRQPASDFWSRQRPIVHSDSVFFNRLLARGINDLLMMATPTPEGPYPYGGIPWYVCPFGRDALLTSLEFLPWFPEIARGTLGFLAAHQGQKVDEFTEEEPGRILHEYRSGEMANCREIPFIPYYGTIDATPLFLVVLGHYLRWSNDLDFLRDHWTHALAAARWMSDYGDKDGDGFLEYAKTSSGGLVNQGWKDSWDAIMQADGTLAQPPIALCEVQGYAYAAYREMSYLATRLGMTKEARHWEQQADKLQRNFLQQFWWEEEGSFYLALDGQKNPCKVVSSNAGQCLWTGIVPAAQAAGVMKRLMAEDMYTHWGIRTLAATASRYNPMSYHNGSVWPHDTALIGAGFAHAGQAQMAGQLLGNLLGVSLHYPDARLPELFCGFARSSGYGPTQYPAACAPQSWAAGAPFLLLSALLGFQPAAEQQRLTLLAPALPEWLHSLDLGHLKLGKEELHLRFEHFEHGTSVTLTEATKVELRVEAP